MSTILQHPASAPATAEPCAANAIGLMIAHMIRITEGRGPDRHSADRAADAIQPLVEVLAFAPATSPEGAYIQLTAALGNATCLVVGDGDGYEPEHVTVMRLMVQVLGFFETHFGFTRENQGLHWFADMRVVE